MQTTLAVQAAVVAAPRPAAGPQRISALRPAARHIAAPSRHTQIRVSTVRAVAETAENGASASAPEPVVRIDNESDPFATVVTVEYGDMLGELLDTVASLKALGLNIRRAKIKSDKKIHKFFVTDAARSEKVVASAKIEEIRLTILNTLLRSYPELGEHLAWGSAAARSSVVRDVDPTAPLGRRRRSIQTQIEVRESSNGAFSTLLVNTLDRPGLLTDIVRVLKDINLNVVSAEVDTIGRNAFDKFALTYHGEALPKPMCELCINALQYYLSQNEDVEKEWSESY